VKIENTTVLAAFDQFAAAGGKNIGLMRTFNVTPADSTLTIDFIHVTENPTIKAIEILQSAPAASMTVAPSQLSFGTVNVGVTSPAQTVTLTNTGATTVTISGYPISGANAGDFHVSGSTTPFNIASGASAQLSVTFGPTAIGARSATLTINSPNVGPQSVSLSGTGQAAPTLVLYRVNAGGPQLAAADGSSPPWSADTATAPSPFVIASPQKTSTTTANITLDSSVPASAPMALFQTERYDPAGAPEMTWNFPVQVGDALTVRLYFAEIYTGITAAGQRVFDVNIENQLALDNVDAFAVAGLNKGFMRSYNVTMTDNNLDIDFIHATQNPMIKGIEIIKNN
jgi:large repetitive protein